MMKPIIFINALMFSPILSACNDNIILIAGGIAGVIAGTIAGSVIGAVYLFVKCQTTP